MKKVEIDDLIKFEHLQGAIDRWYRRRLREGEHPNTVKHYTLAMQITYRLIRAHWAFITKYPKEFFPWSMEIVMHLVSGARHK